jgi:hypothetical protein
MGKQRVFSEEHRRKLSESHKGQVPWCKGKILVPLEIQRAKRLAYRRAWAEKNREKLAEQSRQSKAKHREQVNARARARYYRRRDEELARHRLAKYGMDQSTYDVLVAAQDGRCPICGERPTINLSVDHDHYTGQIRGLICNDCNIAIAKAKDSPTLLRAMADYLEK